MVVKNENCIKICVKGYGVLSFAKNMGKSKSNKCGQKLLDIAKKSTTDAVKTASKREFKEQQKQLVICLVIRFLIE